MTGHVKTEGEREYPCKEPGTEKFTWESFGVDFAIETHY